MTMPRLATATPSAEFQIVYTAEVNLEHAGKELSEDAVSWVHAQDVR